MLPLVQRLARGLGLWLAPAWGGDLRLVPDLDEVEALAPERETLWKRVGAAGFLSDAEKRAAVGWKEERGIGDIGGVALKFRPDQARDDRGRWVDEGRGEGDNAEPDNPGFALTPGQHPDEPEHEPQDDTQRDPSDQFQPVILVGDRPLTGRGHHMLTNQTARAIGNFSPDALKVFDDVVANGGGKLVADSHRYSKEHHQYNQRLTPLVREWLDGNNVYRRAIDASQMTKPQARELLNAINKDPALSSFNRNVYKREVIDGFRRRPPRSPD